MHRGSHRPDQHARPRHHARRRRGLARPARARRGAGPRRTPSPSSVTCPTATRRRQPSRPSSAGSTPTPTSHGTHLGDIKCGSTTCDDQRFATDPARLRRVRRPAGLHARRQRVDRLPPRQQRRLPARWSGSPRSARLFFPRPAAPSGGRCRSPRRPTVASPRTSATCAPGCRSRPLHVVGSNNDLAAVDRARQDHPDPRADRRGARPDECRHRQRCTPPFGDARRDHLRAWCSSSRPTCSTRP